MPTGSIAHLQITLFSLAFLTFALILISNANLISIDITKNSVSFKNIITRKLRSYPFSSLDGYVDTVQRDGKGTKYEITYLVKDKIFIEKISSFSCSNYDELKKGLNNAKYLGFQNFTIIDSIKVMLGMNVLNI